LLTQELDVEPLPETTKLFIVLPFNICIERENYAAFWKASEKSV
jgi:hypothetical protein